MQAIQSNLLPMVSLLGWSLLWGLGGIWIARAAFFLRRNELALVGVGLGLVIQNWTVNLLGQLLPISMAAWLAAFLVLAVGFALMLLFKRQQPMALLQIPILPLQWIILILLALVFIGIGRGLGLLDDHQNLPMTSFLAAGDIPPHFALNPDIRYGYHYFTLLLAAQLVHVADFFVWTALDIARGFGFALTLMLSGLFVQRVTGSALAGLAGGMMTAFSGGARWLLLILPSALLERLGTGLTLIGSGALTGDRLVVAMTGTWVAAGQGPLPFPYAYVNGFNPTNVLTYHSGFGGLSTLLLALLLLLHNKGRGWPAWGVLTVLVAALGLSNEVLLAAVGMGAVLVTAVNRLAWKKRRLPPMLGRWLVIIFAGGFLALFQGGVITTLLMDRLATLLPNLLPTETAYHTFRFSLFWPPKMLSYHLGYLALNQPAQVLLAMAEIGPILLVMPLAGAWMIKAVRYGRWFESFLGFAALASLGLLVVELSGAAGQTALTRAQNLLPMVLTWFAVPTVWLWARHRSEQIKALAAAFLLVNMFGGLMLFGVSLIATQRPVATEFIADLDAAMAADCWDILEEGALVLDAQPFRAPVIFARASHAALDPFQANPEWSMLVENPDPYALRAAGYRYIYVDEEYWSMLTDVQRSAFDAGCPSLVHEEKAKRLAEFRRLYDVSACQ